MSLLSASPTLQPTASLSVKKRKRDETTTSDAPVEIDSRPFAIKPSGDDVFGKITHFTPVCLLQRAHLPLAALDLQGSGSRFFAAHVHTLEALHENGIEGHMLVAEQKEQGRLYVVERASKRIYALCRLGGWITKESLSRLAQVQTKEAPRVAKRRITAPVGTSPWWSQAAVDLPPARQQDLGPTPRLLQFQKQTHPPKAVSGIPVDGASFQATSKISTELAPEHPRSEINPADAAPQDPLEELARFYLDALYISRTSLAYFVKGPLSRARSTIASGPEIPTASSNLVDFLRNSVLPVNVMDKKFKDYLPALIKDLPLVTPSQDEKPAKSRRKKRFKPKRDKSGLFTNEQEYLEKWWRGEEVPGSMTSPESTDNALRRRTPGLRTRETYLQVIIILETIYLETTTKATNPAVEGPTTDSQDAETQDAESQAAAGTSKRKGKKALDLRSLLETLLDRLCIWQDLDAPAPARSLLGDKDAKQNEPSNELRDFCIEIIIPFFTSRLPKEAALVNKKLGGPSPPSPEKRKPTSSRSRPGEPATRSRPEKQPRKPLKRVATETLNQASRQMPGLHRSSTDSALIKREDSQPALSSIPAARPQSRAPRESALSSYLSGHRQVDLVAKSAAAAERLRKKKETEAQVREAINNARKPNRPMATKEVAARADERFAQTLAKSSRSSRPNQQSHPQSQPQQTVLHVAATPKRTKSQGSTLTNAYAAPFVPTSTHSSNPSVIPASSVRPSIGYRIDSTPAVSQTSHRPSRGIEETPSRNSSSKFAQLLASPSARRSAPMVGLCESPSATRRTIAAPGFGEGVAATPVKAVGRRVDFGKLGETPPVGGSGGRGKERAAAVPSGGGLQVEATPVKRSTYGIFGTRDDDMADGSGHDLVGGKSIYDAWNDDDYEELA